MDKNLLFSITERELKTLLEVKYCTASDNTRPILQGICFNSNNNQLEACALDGYRISKRTIQTEINNNFNFILDHESILNLSKVSKKNDNIVNVYSTNDYIEFEFIGQDNKIIKCSLLQGDFVKYNNLIPDEYELELKVDAKKVLEAVKTIKKANADHRIIKLNIQDDEIVIPYKLIEEEYNEEESLKAQQRQQDRYNDEYELKYNKWLEKVERVKNQGRILKAKEPVKKIAKFEKIYITTKEEDLEINICCKINKNEKNNEFLIAFNIKYLEEAVKVYKNEITLKFNSNRSPLVITQDDKNLEMILPVRLLNN